MLKFQGRLVEVSEMGTYQGSPYASVKLRTETSRGDEIVKFKLNVKDGLELETVREMLDTDVTLVCTLERGQQDIASLRVNSVE